MSNTVIRLFLLSAALVTVSGCANRAAEAILDPQYQGGQYHQFNQTVSLQVNDQRANKATLIVSDGEHSQQQLTQGLDSKLTRVFEQGLQRNGAQVSAMGATHIRIAIHDLHAHVEQNTVDHNSTAKIALQVFVQRNGSQFNKMYNGQSQFSGPFGYDQAKVEAQLNKQIEQLVIRIMNDPELNNYMQKGAS